MKQQHTQPVFLLDPTIDQYDRDRVAYALENVLTQFQLRSPGDIMCDGSISAGFCTVCRAPTTLTSHIFFKEHIPFSSSNECLLALMHDLLQQWSLQDLRLLGTILRDDDPFSACQDIIHVNQHRHPLGIAWFQHPGTPWSSDPDHIRELAPDVFFVPVSSFYQMPSDDPPQAGLFIGRVLAHLTLSPKTLRAGAEDPNSQWVSFAPDRVHLPLTEHPSWQCAFSLALDDFIAACHEEEEPEEIIDFSDILLDEEETHEENTTVRLKEEDAAQEERTTDTTEGIS
ncbi:hypothetical protein ccbrp13_29370 [Ktedonobacteria bacterium brp13]|nr:hypothetical protein ccbrp13_29370 [Ktedonobacteria bacterium brp13]